MPTLRSRFRSLFSRRPSPKPLRKYSVTWRDTFGGNNVFGLSYVSAESSELAEIEVLHLRPLADIGSVTDLSAVFPDFSPLFSP